MNFLNDSEFLEIVYIVRCKVPPIFGQMKFLSKLKELIIYNARYVKGARLWNDCFILWESNKSQVKFYVPKASYNQIARLVYWVTNVEMKRKSYKSKITSYARQCISQCSIDH